MKPVIRIQLVDDSGRKFFGEGPCRLLGLVEELGSLRSAAASMGMAYSKAWRIMKDTESALGTTLLNRDGAHGSTLTEEGNLILDTYIEVEKVLQEQGEKLLASRLA